MTVQHQLQHSWTLYVDAPQSKKTTSSNWAANLKQIAVINSVEEFWKVYNNISEASELHHGMNYRLFKTGIKPEWEDEKNKNGGVWTLYLKGDLKDKVDTLWLYTMMLCIGEQFDDMNNNCGDNGATASDDIAGCVVSIRKQGDRIALWTMTASDEQKQMAIARKLKAVLDIPDKVDIAYTVHKDVLSRGKSSDRYKC
ncbi:hypothetical protein MP228_004808 [Amoeboaphelidium protococcarum]|nr:hypothetical protein MP228_004808 [Amoeboaphelidium protococcarum]